jgi:hypothetical protein
MKDEFFLALTVRTELFVKPHFFPLLNNEWFIFGQSRPHREIRFWQEYGGF